MGAPTAARRAKARKATFIAARFDDWSESPRVAEMRRSQTRWDGQIIMQLSNDAEDWARGAKVREQRLDAERSGLGARIPKKYFVVGAALYAEVIGAPVD